MRKQSRAYSYSRRDRKLMEKRELVNTGMYTEKQAVVDMEHYTEFMARLLRIYGTERTGRRKDAGICRKNILKSYPYRQSSGLSDFSVCFV